MGSASEYVAFLNMDKLPSRQDMQSMFSHIRITDEMIRERQAYRRNLSKSEKEGARGEDEL